MKATNLIRRQGLKHRMPQEPLEFLSEMNTLCMKMAAKDHSADGRKQRKKVLREMKALERIIGGRQVSNQDKILSLYDGDINVIKRGKADAEVEFGNNLWLGETREGVIVDYQLYQDNPSDSALVKPGTHGSNQRIENQTIRAPRAREKRKYRGMVLEKDETH